MFICLEDTKERLRCKKHSRSKSSEWVGAKMDRNQNNIRISNNTNGVTGVWKQNVTSPQNISRSVLDLCDLLKPQPETTEVWFPLLFSRVPNLRKQLEETGTEVLRRSRSGVHSLNMLGCHRFVPAGCRSPSDSLSFRDVTSANISVWNWSGSRTTERSLVLLHIHSQWSPERTVRRSLTTSCFMLVLRPVARLNHRHFRSVCTTCVTVTLRVSESSQRPQRFNTVSMKPLETFKKTVRLCVGGDRTRYFKPKHDLIWTVS